MSPEVEELWTQFERTNSNITKMKESIEALLQPNPNLRMEKFVLSKSLFLWNVYFIEKFLLLLKVFFVNNFVLSKSLFLRKNFFDRFSSNTHFSCFFGRDQCKISPWSQICWNFKDPTRIKWVMAIFLSLKCPLQLSQELSVHEDYVNRKKTP